MKRRQDIESSVKNEPDIRCALVLVCQPPLPKSIVNNNQEKYTGVENE